MEMETESKAAGGGEAGPSGTAQLRDGMLVSREPLRSLNKGISLYLLTYISQELWVKGYLAVAEQALPALPLIYCRGGIRKVGMVRKRRIISMAKRGFAVFAPFYRGNEGGEGVTVANLASG